MTKKAPRRQAFTLIEMVVVIVMVAMLGGIMALLLVETMGVERTQREGFDKILRTNALADQFRADVAQAESAPDKWRDFQAGKDILVLLLPGGKQVVYLWKEKALKRLAFQDQKETERAVPLGEGPVDLEFVRDNQNPKLIRLRLHPLREGSPLAGQTLELAAALGGDLR